MTLRKCKWKEKKKVVKFSGGKVSLLFILKKTYIESLFFLSVLPGFCIFKDDVMQGELASLNDGKS